MKINSILFSGLLLFGSLSFSFSQNALHFDGSNDYVQTSFPGILGTNARTFEAWVKVDVGAATTNLCILDYGSGAAQSRNTLSIGGTRNLVFIAGGTNTNMSSGTNTITVGQWNHVAFVLDNGTGYMYINGSLVGTGNLSNVNTPSGSTNLRIGERVSGGTIPFQGVIDEVRIWDVARTGTEIANNRNAEFCTVPPNLVAYFTFNQGTAAGNNSGLTSLHNAVQNANGTLTNFSLSGATSNWVSGASITAGLSVSKNSATVCDSMVSPSGLYSWTSSGNYYDTLTNANNCDSILRFSLTVNNSVYEVVNDTSCFPYTSPSGKYTYTTTGTYFDTTLTSKGCTHVHELNLVLNILDTSLSLSGHTLTANQSVGIYSWLDCNNNYAPISGATGKSFTPSTDGEYAARIELFKCIDTTECVAVYGIGIKDDLSDVDVKLYPNPTKGSIVLEVNEASEDLSVEIYTMSGQIIEKSLPVNKGRTVIELPEQKGLYLVKVFGDSGLKTFRVVRE